MYETLDKIDGPNFKQNRFFPATNDSYNYTTCSKMIYLLNYIFYKQYKKPCTFSCWKKNVKRVKRSATSDSIKVRCVIKIDIAPNEHNCDDTITLIIIGYACALLYIHGTIIKI